MAEREEYDPTYRQLDIDRTLENHNKRIRRLEKGGLIALGYAVAEGGTIVTELSALLL